MRVVVVVGVAVQVGRLEHTQETVQQQQQGAALHMAVEVIPLRPSFPTSAPRSPLTQK